MGKRDLHIDQVREPRASLADAPEREVQHGRSRRRRKYEEEPDAGHDRWMVSYADFVTLLFALFVVMYAVSSVNQSKYRAMADSLVSAFGSSGTMQPAAVALPPVPMMSAAPPKRNNEALRREKEHMTRIARDILQVMAPLINQGKVRVTQTERGVKVEINASVLFAPGDAKLTEESSQALKAVAEVLNSDHHAIQVEGHTDAVPIRNASFASNWELSAVRASSVVRLFSDGGIAETRLSAVGRGPTQPVASNDTPDGRLQNRRVAVMIMSALPEAVTEVPVN